MMSGAFFHCVCCNNIMMYNVLMSDLMSSAIDRNPFRKGPFMTLNAVLVLPLVDRVSPYLSLLAIVCQTLSCWSR